MGENEECKHCWKAMMDIADLHRDPVEEGWAQKMYHRTSRRFGIRNAVRISIRAHRESL